MGTQQLPFTSGSLARLRTVGGRRDDAPPPRDPQQLRTAAEVLHLLRKQAPSQSYDDPWVQVKNFTGVIFAAIKPISSLFAGATYSIVRRKKPHRNRSTFGPKGTFAKALPTAHAHARDDEYTVFDDYDHPLARLIEHPNQVETFGMLARKACEQYLLTGIAPLWVVPSAAGKPLELWSLKTPTTTPLYAQSQQYPDGAWRVQPYFAGGFGGMIGGRIGAAGAILPGNEIARFLDPHPYMEGAGYSRLTAAGVQLDVLQSIDRSRKTVMDEGVTLNAALIVPGMDEPSVKRIEEKMQQSHGGAENAGRFLVIAPPAGMQPGDKADLKTFSGSPADLGHAQGWEQMSKFCTAVFGTPPSIVFPDASNYSSHYAARQQFHDQQSENVHHFADFLTQTLARPYQRFPGEYRVQIDLPDIGDKEMLEKQLQADVNIRSVNQRLALRNLPPVKHGEWPESIYLKLVEQEAMPQQPAQPQPGAMPPGMLGGAADPSQTQPTAQPAPGGQLDDRGGLGGAGAQNPQETQGKTPLDDTSAQQPNPDPLASLLGGAGEQQAAGDDTQESVLRAALKALGLGDEDAPQQKAIAVTKPGTGAKKPPAHREGEKFQSPKDGRWYQVRGGKAVHIAPPTAREAIGEKVNYGRVQPWPTFGATGDTPPPTPAKAGSAATPPPIDGASERAHDALAKQFLNGRPSIKLLALGSGKAVAYEIKDGASLQKFFDAGGKLPEGVCVPHAESVPAHTPEAKKVLSEVDTWAAAKADQHADRVAKHFGIDRAKAHALLVDTITKIAAHAQAHGGRSVGTLRNKDGKQLKLRIGDRGAANKPPKPTPTPPPLPANRGGPTAGAPPRPANPAGKGSRPPLPDTKTDATPKRGLVGRGLDHALARLGTPAEQRLARSRINKRSGVRKALPSAFLSERFAELAAEYGEETARAVFARAGERDAGVAVVLKGEWDEQKHVRDHGKFSSKPGASGGEKIGTGSTGDVVRHGDEAHKNARGHEGKVYAALSGVAGVAPGRQEGDKVITPHFPHVASVDAVPANARGRYTSVMRDAIPRLVNAVTALSQAGYDYNDPIQVGFDKSRTAHLFDFSAAQKTTPEEATRENLGRLGQFLKEFGQGKHGDAMGRVAGVMDYLNSPESREFMGDGDPDAVDAQKVADRLDGKPHAFAYYGFNAREIPGVAQTEHRDGAKAVFSAEPLSDEFLKQWELHPAVHRNA